MEINFGSWHFSNVRTIWPVGRMLKILIFQAVTYSDHGRGDHLITSSAREQLSRMSSKPAV
jgi:hypothetical protein